MVRRVTSVIAFGMMSVSLLCAPHADAQPPPAPAPRIEVFGGYSYLPELDAAVKNVMDAGHGFALAVDVNLHRRFGLRVDFDAHSWTRQAERIGNRDLTAEDITLYYYSIGPRFVQRWNRISVFGLAQLEGQKSSWSGYSVVDALNPNTPVIMVFPAHTSGALGLGVGGGVDARIRQYFAVRILQINYSLGGFGSGPNRRLRLKTGVVLSFGSG